MSPLRPHLFGLVGNNTLGLEHRGSASILIADNGIPLGESSCISCGNCVEICPTGALYDRRSMYQGRETDLTHTETVCMDCSLGCTRVIKTRDNRLVRIDSKFDDIFLGGLLCEKGRYGPLKEVRQRIENLSFVAMGNYSQLPGIPPSLVLLPN